MFGLKMCDTTKTTTSLACYRNSNSENNQQNNNYSSSSSSRSSTICIKCSVLKRAPVQLHKTNINNNNNNNNKGKLVTKINRKSYSRYNKVNKSSTYNKNCKYQYNIVANIANNNNNNNKINYWRINCGSKVNSSGSSSNSSTSSNCKQQRQQQQQQHQQQLFALLLAFISGNLACVQPFAGTYSSICKQQQQHAKGRMQ
ncbi:PREDICTED: homeobox protein 5-like [Rhagoletis zephyria]|uniref:homeobox protein 5-like n=1 Tax=Rhagoletis zephyria TaxID=28612 RepID=UPI00081158E6|nr:PREDICTED: homeobox protein 5-like [Rhagoletis zephyria]